LKQISDPEKVVATVSIISFFRSFSYGSLMSFIVLYLTSIMNVPLTIAGIYLLIAGIFGAFFQIISGVLSDAYGRKRIMYHGQILQGISFIFLGIGLGLKNVILIVFLLIFQNISSSLVFSSTNAIIADFLPPELRFRGYAYQRASANFGWGIGPAIGGFLFSHNYYIYAFMVIGIFLIFFIFLIKRLPDIYGSSGSFTFSDITSSLKDIKFTIYSLAGFISFMIFGQLTSTYPVYETNVNNISTDLIGLTWTMNGFMVAGLQVFFARFAKVKNAFKFLEFGIIIYGFGYFMLSFNSTVQWLFISMLVITMGEIIYSSTATATAMNMSNEKNRGKYAGTFGFFTSIGRSSGTFYGGLIFSLYLSYFDRWFLIFLTAVIASFLYFSVEKRKYSH